MSNLINANHLAKNLGLSRKALTALFEEHLKPVHEMPYGRGSLKVYDEESAMKLVREHYDIDPPAPNTVNDANVGLLVAKVDELTKRLTRLQSAIDVLEESVQEIAKKSTEQAKLTFAKVDAICQGVNKLVSELGATT